MILFQSHLMSIRRCCAGSGLGFQLAKYFMKLRGIRSLTAKGPFSTKQSFTMASIKELAAHWLELDKNEKNKAEIQYLQDVGNTRELEKRLRKRIEFGTAGLRARMEAGFSRMNDLTVIQASQGLASYICNQSNSPSVVIGYDHRHNSSQFARLAAVAMSDKGIEVYLYGGHVHTPLVPFAVNMLAATAGVMITASHNPARDNGYKVYWSNGCQIIPPHDRNISSHIEQNLTPLSWDVSNVLSSDEALLDTVKNAYFKSLRGIAAVSTRDEVEYFKFVYTPMHGVGLAAMERAVADMGLTDNMIVVSEQAQPDPEFPTVCFPNPEEKGALDLAIATADKHNVSLVLASDPDADRFAAAEKLPSGNWEVFTGNQLGVLFAAHTLDAYRQETKIGKISKLAMLASTVSTQMLEAMAIAEGFHYEETLTGFKWLGNQALVLQGRGYDALYAFEEAIGYMFAPVVYDKDGIAAASVFITMVQKWAKEGLTVHDKIEQLYKTYGYFESANSYFISPDPALTKKVFMEIRSMGKPHPAKVGNRKIIRWRDLTEGFDSATSDRKPVLPVDPNSQMITCDLEGAVRFTVRGSGTEPKIKMYIECKAETREAASQGAQEVSESLTQEWFRPIKTGLLLP